MAINLFCLLREQSIYHFMRFVILIDNKVGQMNKILNGIKKKISALTPNVLKYNMVAKAIIEKL